MPQTLYGRLVERFKRRLIRLALRKAKGRMKQAAWLLGLDRRDLYELCRHHRINHLDFR